MSNVCFRVLETSYACSFVWSWLFIPSRWTSQSSRFCFLVRTDLSRPPVNKSVSSSWIQVTILLHPPLLLFQYVSQQYTSYFVIMLLQHAKLSATSFSLMCALRYCTSPREHLVETSMKLLPPFERCVLLSRCQRWVVGTWPYPRGHSRLVLLHLQWTGPGKLAFGVLVSMCILCRVQC